MNYGVGIIAETGYVYPISHNLPYDTKFMQQYLEELNQLATGRPGRVMVYAHVLPHEGDPADCRACISAIEAAYEREAERATHGPQVAEGPAPEGGAGTRPPRTPTDPDTLLP